MEMANLSMLDNRYQVLRNIPFRMDSVAVWSNITKPSVKGAPLVAVQMKKLPEGATGILAKDAWT